MTRGTFANITLKNKLLGEINGPYSVIEKNAKPEFVFDIA